MDWKEYELIRDDVLDILRRGKTIHQLNIIARIHSNLFKHVFYLPNCSTTYVEWTLEIEREYKKNKEL